MIRRSFLAFAALLAAFPAALPTFAQEQGSAAPRPLTDAERQLITEINEHNSAIKTMVGRFLQIDTQGSRIEGTFFLERPGKILFRYNPPSSEQIVSVGRGFYVGNICKAKTLARQVDQRGAIIDDQPAAHLNRKLAAALAKFPSVRQARGRGACALLQPRLQGSRPPEMAWRGLSHPRPSGRSRQGGQRWRRGLGSALPRAGKGPQAVSPKQWAQVAQLVEHVTENHGVGGSIPPLGTTSPL